MFESEVGSKIINDELLIQKTVGILLNEIFSLNKEENEEKMEAFSKENDGKHLTMSNLCLFKIVNFGQI